jgi:hypothetical protein
MMDNAYSVIKLVNTSEIIIIGQMEAGASRGCVAWGCARRNLAAVANEGGRDEEKDDG